MRIIFSGESGSGWAPHLVDIDTGLRPSLEPDRGCVAVARLDGLPLRMRPAAPIRLADRQAPGTAWVGCSPVTLGAGAHTLRSESDYQIDTLAFRDRQGLEPVAAGTARALSISGSTTDQRVTFDVGTTPVVVKIGQGYDARWTAEIDGHLLGAPVVVDGWSVGWIVSEPGRHSVHVRFAPQRAATRAAWVSGLAVLGCAAWLVVAWLPRRRPGLV